MFTKTHNSHYSPTERQATALSPDALRQKSAALYYQCISESIVTAQHGIPVETGSFWVARVNIVRREELTQFGAVKGTLGFTGKVIQQH